MNRQSLTPTPDVKPGTVVLYVPQRDECYSELERSNARDFIRYTVKEVINITGEYEVILYDVVGHFLLTEFVLEPPVPFNYEELMKASNNAVEYHNLSEMRDIITSSGGTVQNVTKLTDQDGMFVASWPLPKDHWLYTESDNEPPMGMLMGTNDPQRAELQKHVVAAVRYAYKVNTRNGTDLDLDPDSLVNDVVIGLMGWYTPDGTNNTSDLQPLAPIDDGEEDTRG